VQDILQAGTAVLADERGNPVVRCRCGNPLLAPRRTAARVRCEGCPPGYDISRVCAAGARCQRRYPNPPPVRGASQGCDFEGPPDLTAEVKASVDCATAVRILKRFLQQVTGHAEIEGWTCFRTANVKGGYLAGCTRPNGESLGARLR
jgi:hypothetical protein